LHIPGNLHLPGCHERTGVDAHRANARAGEEAADQAKFSCGCATCVPFVGCGAGARQSPLARDAIRQTVCWASAAMWPLSIVIQHLELALRLHAAVPYLPPETAYAHVQAASAAATQDVTPELLLGIAFVESRFDPTAVSRVEGRKRRTGSYPSTSAPASLDRRASLYCGPLQTFAPSWSACVAMRNLVTAYAAGAAELKEWLRDRRVHGSTVRALAGHGCGNYGVLTGRCNGYPERVLTITRQLRPVPARPESQRRTVASS